MGLTLNDIRQLKVEDFIILNNPDGTQESVEIIEIGLNYMTLKIADGPRKGTQWNEDLDVIMLPNRYSIYIPPPPKKKSWINRKLKKFLKYILAKL